MTKRFAKLGRPAFFMCFGLAAILASAASTLDQSETTVLRDVDESGTAFGFKEGGLINLAEEEMKVPPNVDLLFDLPHGLAANNSQLDSVFTGRGGILDMGKVSLEEVKEAPEKTFPFFLEPKDLIVGHTYCVLTADGKHYGKIHLVTFSEERRLIEFTWRYQPKDTRTF